METIEKIEGKYYYGREQCESVEDAYCRFRDDYHRELGRNFHRRLDRSGSRTERIHGFGFVFDTPVRCDFHSGGNGRIHYSMALVVTSYCRIFGVCEQRHLTDEQFDRWFDWALSKGSGAMKLCGRKDKTGRTSKTLNKHYK